jgi:hypothetical protein
MKEGLISVIVPTYNEREAVPALVDRVRRALGGSPTNSCSQTTARTARTR